MQDTSILEPTAPSLYAQVGLGALPPDTAAARLYIDMVKRAVLNVIYEDAAAWYFDERNEHVLANSFDLQHRVYGKDLPTEAHTMVGLKRLENLQQAVETLIDERVPGDLVETGVLRGGAAIFLRAVLKAYGVTDRRVVACDTFIKRKPMGNGLAARLTRHVIPLLASIPSKRWHRRFFFIVQNMMGDQRSFPLVTDPSDHMVEGVMWTCRNLNAMKPTRDRTSLEAVRSHFARYGLLDEQVLFLQGFFSETLPGSPVTQVALLRLDGDTYESTMDVLQPMYPRLSDGGYCIVDDYHAFPDCKRAVDEYRAVHGIQEPMVPIDQHAVYWRKGRTGPRA